MDLGDQRATKTSTELRLVKQDGAMLIVGGGIGGLTAAIALCRSGFAVEIIERDPTWSVYGVGIIQQANALRAMKALDVIDDYVAAGFGFDHVDIFLPNGHHIARVPSPGLVEGYPANLGIGRRALHKVLGDRAIQAGATIRLGVTIDRLVDDGDGVDVVFSDGTSARYAIVIGADGVYSRTRQQIFPEAPGPRFAGQAVWRYNLPLAAGMDSLHVYEGPAGIGLVPLSSDLMYIYLTTPAAEGERYQDDMLAATMRSKLPTTAPAIAAIAEQIVDDAQVVHRPLDWLLLEGPWHKGRVVLLGDAVHATTPHLGQGAGMAIEDGLVLADELVRHGEPEDAFQAYFDRRFARCAAIVRLSLAICDGQLGRGPRVDASKASHDMFAVVSAPL